MINLKSLLTEETKYNTDGTTIFYRKTALATIIKNKSGYELVLKQGLPRDEVKKLIFTQFPNFGKKQGIKQNVHVMLRSDDFFKQLNK